MSRMRVQVPRDIAGGSLLGAHNWVKSTITRTNPGESTNDYKLQQIDGTPISLSDLSLCSAVSHPTDFRENLVGMTLSQL